MADASGCDESQCPSQSFFWYRLFMTMIAITVAMIIWWLCEENRKKRAAEGHTILERSSVTGTTNSPVSESNRIHEEISELHMRKTVLQEQSISVRSMVVNSKTLTALKDIQSLQEALETKELTQEERVVIEAEIEKLRALGTKAEQNLSILNDLQRLRLVLQTKEMTDDERSQVVKEIERLMRISMAKQTHSTTLIIPSSQDGVFPLKPDSELNVMSEMQRLQLMLETKDISEEERRLIMEEIQRLRRLSQNDLGPLTDADGTIRLQQEPELYSAVEEEMVMRKRGSNLQATPGGDRRESGAVDEMADEIAPLKKESHITHASQVDGHATDEQSKVERKASRKVSVLEVMGASTAEEVVVKMHTLEEISVVMRQAGLVTSNLIFGIDYTASNKYQGEESFNGKSLHSIKEGILNPYQEVITVMGKTLAPFSTSGLIPAFGFGDVHTSDWSIFALDKTVATNQIDEDGNPLTMSRHCASFDEVLEVYNTKTPRVILSGPTNFAPLIYKAIEICKEVKDYHILVIVADGQVTNERATRKAIVEACDFPLSIIVVGVGDGPWDMMTVFDDELPIRSWDNFHFVEFHKIAKDHPDNTDLAFAVEALLEIPDQYKAIRDLGMLRS